MKNFGPKPPPHLSAGARQLWARLLADFTIEDAAGIQLLRVTCEAHDRAAQAARLIRRHGAVVKDRFGQLRANPACAIERDAKTTMLNALRSLRLEPEDSR